MTIEPSQKLLTTAEAAILINIAKSTFYRLLGKRTSNGLDKAAKKKGGQWRFDSTELLKWDSKAE